MATDLLTVEIISFYCRNFKIQLSSLLFHPEIQIPIRGLAAVLISAKERIAGLMSHKNRPAKPQPRLQLPLIPFYKIRGKGMGDGVKFGQTNLRDAIFFKRNFTPQIGKLIPSFRLGQKDWGRRDAVPASNGLPGTEETS